MLIFLIWLVQTLTVVERFRECSQNTLCENMPLQLNADLYFSIKYPSQYYWSTPLEDQKISFSAIIENLLQTQDSLFQVSEVYHFRVWYEAYEKKQIVDQLVNEGRIEFMNGGLVSHDQATANYQDIISSMQLGWQWLRDTFNKTPIVAYNTQSKTQNALNAQFGIKYTLIDKLDSYELVSRVKNQTAQFLWKSGDYSTLTSIKVRKSAQVKAFSQMKGDGFCLSVFSQLKDFEQIVLLQRQGATQDAIYHSEEYVPSSIETYNGVIQFYSVFNCRSFRARWSTAQEYFEQVRKYPQVKTNDFFPYQEGGQFHTAYYTTLPSFKYFVRWASLQVQSLTMFSLKNNIFQKLLPLRELIAQAQFLISGVSKYSVMEEAQKQIQLNIDVAYQKISSSLKPTLVGQSYRTNIKKGVITDCSSNQKCLSEYLLKNRHAETAILLIYNSQHKQLKEYSLELITPNISILNFKAQKLEKQEVKCFEDQCLLTFEYLMEGYQEEQFILDLQCTECAPIIQPKMKLDLSELIPKLEKEFEQGNPIETVKWIESVDDIQIHVARLGIDYQFEFEFRKSIFKLNFNFYPNIKNSQFSATQKRQVTSQAGKTIMMNDYSSAGLICVFEQLFVYPGAIFKEIILVCGKIYQINIHFKDQGIEIQTQMNSSGLQSGDYTMQIQFLKLNQSRFFTDSNGLHSIERFNNKREDYEYEFNQLDAVNANTFPFTAYAQLQGLKDTYTLLTDRAQGIFSLTHDSLEVVLEHFGGDDGLSTETCTKKVNNNFRHMILLNDECIRCSWHEWQLRNHFMRISESYHDNTYQIVNGDRNIRLEFQSVNEKQYLLYVENLSNGLQQFDNLILDNLVDRNFNIVSATLSGQILEQALDLELKPYQIKAYIITLLEH